MTTNPPTCDLERPAPLNTREALICEVRRGLLRRPRSLSPWMFYDSYGFRLFERITQLPEYYLTRTERNILATSAIVIVAEALGDSSGPLRLVELGAGTASKTAVLLDALVKLQGEVVYIPIDVSTDALDIARTTIASLLPEVCVKPIVA